MSHLQGIATRAIRGGRRPDPSTGAIVPPICQSTTFVQDRVGVHKGFTYSRAANPTVEALERAIGALEGTPPAVCYSSGMAAIAGLCFALLRAGDHVVVSDAVYGGTVRFVRRVLGEFGVGAVFVDTSDAGAVRAAIGRRTRLVLVETPANPTLRLTDIAAVAAVCRGVGVPLAVDNTFLTPVLQRPLDLGADICVYSTTKYFDGHNATIGGAITTRDAALLERLAFIRKTLGSIQSPQEAWLTLRGLATLPARLERQCAGAQRVAAWLESIPRVRRVYYPGLPSFSRHDLVRTQQCGAGGALVSFELDGGLEAGIALMNGLRLCSLAENLGAVETLVTHPASMTHADVPPDQRGAAGITDGLVRLSVGLEDPEDIIADLEQALARAAAERNGSCLVAD
jgi:cystathionine beta-lyase/cystathionine gamma-synthase